MLPQMMPLPWLFVFSLLFICFYSMYLYLMTFFVTCESYSHKMMFSKIVIVW